MARPLRIEFPGAVYHVTMRGNHRAGIYRDDSDRACFIEVLAETVKRFNWICHAECLLSDQYHLVIETPEGNLSVGMRHLNQVYTQKYNRRHRVGGPLFQGRFKALIIEKEAHLLEMCRYVVLTPVHAGLAAHPKQWLWSSYGATAGSRKAPAWLRRDWTLSQFSTRRKTAQRKYRAFVREGLGEDSALRGLRNGFILGSEAFAAQCMAYLEEAKSPDDIPQRQALAERPDLPLLFDEVARQDKMLRNQRIAEAHLKHRYTMTKIGKEVGLSLGMISRIVNAARK